MKTGGVWRVLGAEACDERGDCSSREHVRARTDVHRLIVALLADAWTEYRDAVRWGRRAVLTEIETWLDGADAAVPFNVACEALDLDPATVRERFRHLRERRERQRYGPAMVAA